MNQTRRTPTMRRPLRVAAPLAAAVAGLCAFAGSAMAATGPVGPYTVTDEVSHFTVPDGDGVAQPFTSATYTIFVPASTQAAMVQAISHVDAGVCNLDGRTYSITRDDVPFGALSSSGDDSITGLNTPVIKWDKGQNNGTTVKYAYTVPGTWDAATTKLYIKSGSGGGNLDPHDAFSGDVQGIACANTPPPNNPGDPGTPGDPGNPGDPGTPLQPLQPLVPATPQDPGQQQVLGERVSPGSAHIAGASGCQRKAFKVAVNGKNISKVTFSIDGKRVGKVRASASKNNWSISVNPNSYKPGSHVVTAKVQFTTASGTKSKTLRARFARCVRATAPAFTG